MNVFGKNDVEVCQKSWKLVEEFWRYKQMWAVKRSGLLFWPTLYTKTCIRPGAKKRNVCSTKLITLHVAYIKYQKAITGDRINHFSTNNTHTHTTVLRLCGICPGQPGWAGTRRNIHPLKKHSPTQITWQIIKSDSWKWNIFTLYDSEFWPMIILIFIHHLGKRACQIARSEVTKIKSFVQTQTRQTCTYCISW